MRECEKKAHMGCYAKTAGGRGGVKRGRWAPTVTESKYLFRCGMHAHGDTPSMGAQTNLESSSDANLLGYALDFLHSPRLSLA